LINKGISPILTEK